MPFSVWRSASCSASRANLSRVCRACSSLFSSARRARSSLSSRSRRVFCSRACRSRADVPDPRCARSSLLEGLNALPFERGFAFTDERLQAWIVGRNPETVVQETDRDLVCRLVARLCQNPDERLFPLAGFLFALSPFLFELAGFLQAPGFVGLSPLLLRAPLLDAASCRAICVGIRGSAGASVKASFRSASATS